MKPSRLSSAMVALALSSPLMLFTSDALAQVPPHRPGEICFTSKLWCWQKPPGPPGAACSCLTPLGPLSGRLG